MQSTRPLFDRISHPRRRHAMAVRHRVESGIRTFFQERDFLETRTPLLVPCPGMETHIRPYQTMQGPYLPTSPEFAMKRLLVGGLKSIFQICPAFRDEPTSPQHSPEFTLLEFYRAHATEMDIQNDFEQLVETLSIQFFGKTMIPFQGTLIDVSTPWPRLSTDDLFLKYADVSLVRCTTRESLQSEIVRLKATYPGLYFDASDTWDDLYFRIWLTVIEPQIPTTRALFVVDYPPSQAALAVVKTYPDGRRRARRFEPYAGGMELGNGFYELTDPVEQRKRFEEDMNLREKIYGPTFPKNPIDEGFLAALEEGLPPSAGVAIGVDRLVMLFADEPDLDFTLWLPANR